MMEAGTDICVNHYISMCGMVPHAEQTLNYKYLLNEKTRSKRIISRPGDTVKEEKTSWNMDKVLEYLSVTTSATPIHQSKLLHLPEEYSSSNTGFWLSS